MGEGSRPGGGAAPSKEVLAIGVGRSRAAAPGRGHPAAVSKSGIRRRGAPAPALAMAGRDAVKRWAALAALLLATGCGGLPAGPSSDPGALVPGPSGLSVAGTGAEIGFGRAEAGARRRPPRG